MAFRGIDFRDLHRPGSGLTLRRLFVLVKGIPADDPLWVEWRAANAAAQKAKPDLIRDRKAAFEARNRRAREVADV